MKKKCLLMLLIVVLCSLTIFSSDVVLKVWGRLANFEEIVDMFNEKMEKEGKSLRAEFVQVPYDQLVSKFMAALGAKKAPDVYALDLVHFPYFISIGAFEDITEWATSREYFDELPDGLLKLGSKDEKVFALPYEIDLSTMIWNKDMFREAGLDPENPPETWYELLVASQKLTKDFNNDGVTDQWGIALVGNDAGSYMFWFMPWVWSNGGSMFDDNGNVVFNSPESKETLQLWYDLIHKYKVAPVSSAQWSFADRYNAFISGKIAMFLGGNFSVSPIMTDAPDMDFGVTFMPRGSGEFSTFGGGELIGIPSQTKHKEEALEFLEFAMSDAMIEAYAPDLMLLPRPSLFDNEYYNAIPQMEAFAEILTKAKTPYTFKYNQIYDPVLYYLQGALLGKIGVDEAIEKCDEEIREIMK